MKSAILLALIVLLPGCAVRYACPAPKGVRCQPISEVYASAGKDAAKTDDPKPTVPRRSLDEQPTPPEEGGAPIRTAPKILRVWIAPWIDQEGDLHREGELFLVIHSGAWTLGEPAPKEETVHPPERPLLPPPIREEPITPSPRETEEDPDAP